MAWLSIACVAFAAVSCTAGGVAIGDVEGVSVEAIEPIPESPKAHENANAMRAIHNQEGGNGAQIATTSYKLSKQEAGGTGKKNELSSTSYRLKGSVSAGF